LSAEGAGEVSVIVTLALGWHLENHSTPPRARGAPRLLAGGASGFRSLWLRGRRSVCPLRAQTGPRGSTPDPLRTRRSPRRTCSRRGHTLRRLLNPPLRS